MNPQEVQQASTLAANVVDLSQAALDGALQGKAPAPLAALIVQHHHIVRNLDAFLHMAQTVVQSAEHMAFVQAIPFSNYLPLLEGSMQFLTGILDGFNKPSTPTPAPEPAVAPVA